jgi:hypothetical protein
VAWSSLRSHASRASSEQDQIGSRRTGAAHPRDPRGATRDVHFPDPLGSDTFCRELVELPAGEADISRRLRALPELTGVSEGSPATPGYASIPWRTCFREARCLPPCLRRPFGFEDRLSRSSAKRPVIRGVQGVFRP